jgi:6-phosphogluconolactonase
MSKPDVIVVPDRDALADEAAARMEQIIVEAAKSAELASLALAGGATPEVTYRHLASRPVPWRCLQIFFGDERCVPPEDEASNYHLAERAILDRIPLRPRQVHRIRGEIDPERAAVEAEAAMHDNLPGKLPSLDLILLGMGPDGHVASLFPGAPEVEVDDRLYVPVHHPELPQPHRVSVTLPVINAARHVMVIAAGEETAAAAARALDGDPGIPAGRLAPTQGELTWILTEEAAASPGR